MEKTLENTLLIINENEKLIANILHDVKSPLYSIKIALQAKLSENKNELNNDIYETIVDVLKYIENFLVDYSFKKGKFEQKPSFVDIKEIIKNKLETNKYIFINKNIFIDLVFDDDDYKVNTIAIFLSSIIGNIISNIALHGNKNQRVLIELTRKKDFVEAAFKNSYNSDDEHGFNCGLEFSEKLARQTKIDFKFTKSKNFVLVNLKIPNLI